MRGQISFFDGSKQFKIDKPVRLIELFAGIGSQSKALERLNVDFEHYRVCEFDKYAVTSYNAIHGTNFVPSDITKLPASDLGITQTEKYLYIMTYSFPCQDLSKAGKQKGMGKDSGTRSGLLWEVERLLDECEELPQMLLMENVPDVIGTKNIQHFADWLKKLERLGYKNYYKVLNAKDYGVPQNRERCFMVSLHGDYYYDFPEPQPLTLRLKDLLEPVVDEKYYLSDAQMQAISENLKNVVNGDICNTVRTSGHGSIDRHSWDMVAEGVSGCKIKSQGKEFVGYTGIAGTIMARDYKGFDNREKTAVIETTQSLGEASTARIIEALNIFELGVKGVTRYSGSVLDADGICNTLSTMQGGNREPKIVEPVLVGGVGKINFGTQWRQGNRIYDSNAIAMCLQAEPVGNAGGNSYLYTVQEPIIGAIRGRNPDNPTSRQSGLPTKQMLEIKADGISNTLTTVQKDNVVIEPSGIYTNVSPEFQRPHLPGISRTIKANSHDSGVVLYQKPRGNNAGGEKSADICPTITSHSWHENVSLIENYRIRKLIPLECWRLMDFDDEDYYKARDALNNTYHKGRDRASSQQYKQAGNSIVVAVLQAIFSEML